MDNTLQNRIAVITGAGGGIGRAIAGKLAQQQMFTVLLGGNNLEKLAETRQLVERYSRCMVIPGDLTQVEFLQSAVAEIAGKCGGIDVLINNAGVAQNTPFEAITPAEFDRIMAINNRSPFFLTQAALPWLRQSPAATVINIASVVAHAGYPQQSAYTASKHALLGWTKSLARECYRDNIRVHAVCPGGVYTDMVKLSRPDLTPEGMIMPEDIAEIVMFFLNNRSNAVIDEICVHRMNKEPF
jgi:3-oxoacyl-[acyl-carrier protein] reductase